MFELRYILLFILLGVCIYLIYSLFSYQSKQFDKLKENIIDTIEIECEEITDKLDIIEQNIDKKILDCNKKIKDLYSLQNKINDVNKMNGQSIINQYNQYDEGDDIIENDNFQNQIFNSTDNHNTNNCFIKINQIKNDQKDMFYMSPVQDDHINSHTINTNLNNDLCHINMSQQNNDTFNNTNDTKSKNTKSSKTSKSSSKNTSKNTSKSSKDNEDSNSIVLEINKDYVKSIYINNNSPNVIDILHKSSSFIKENSTGSSDNQESISKFIMKEINDDSKSFKSSKDDSSNENIDIAMDEPPLFTNIFTTNNNYRNKVIEII